MVQDFSRSRILSNTGERFGEWNSRDRGKSHRAWNKTALHPLSFVEERSEEKFLFHRRVCVCVSSGSIASKLCQSSFIRTNVEERKRRRAEESLLRSHVNSGEGIWSWLRGGGRTSGPLCTLNVCIGWRSQAEKTSSPSTFNGHRSAQMFLAKLHESASILSFSFAQEAREKESEIKKKVHRKVSSLPGSQSDWINVADTRLISTNNSRQCIIYKDIWWHRT